MPQVFTVLGIPLVGHQHDRGELEFPPGSHVARLLMCGLGADIKGDGWRQYFPADAYEGRIAPTDEVLVPALLTGILTIGMNVFALATDLDIAVAWAAIRKDETCGRVAGGRRVSSTHHLAGAHDLGSPAKQCSGGRRRHRNVQGRAPQRRQSGNLWNILLGLGSVIPKVLFSPGADKFFAEIAVEILELEAAEKLLEAIPIIGQVLAVIAAVGDAATLAEVCAETIVSPWVIENEVSLTYDATIEISRDPRASTFPTTARSWRLEALVDGALTLDPVTGSINEGGRLAPTRCR